MNPFKHKPMEEFTIADCELYISKYLYGEHLAEVKRHLKDLTKSQQDKPKDGTKKQKPRKLAPQKMRVKRIL